MFDSILSFLQRGVYMKVNFSLSLEEKLQILSDAAKYDVACTSSGSDRRGKKRQSGELLCCRYLSQLCRRRKVYFSFESPAL